MRIAGVVNVAARSLDQVVDCLLIHVGRALAGQLFAVRACGVGGDDAGTVKAVEADDLEILLDLDDVARLYNGAALSRNTPVNPGVNGLLRADERNRNFISVAVGGGHAAVENVGCPLGGHVVLMIVRRKNGIDMLESERIDDERDVAEIRLHRAAAAHVGHLVADSHLAVAVGALAVAAPEVDCDVGVVRGLKPDTGAAEPPHGDVSLRNDGVLDVLDEPGAPFREGAHDPFLSGHFRDLAHNYYLLFLWYSSFSNSRKTGLLPKAIFTILSL